MINQNIIVLGSGFMASAIVRGMYENKIADMKKVYVMAPHPEKVRILSQKYRVNVANTEDIEKAQIVILAFKPQNFDEAAAQYKKYFNSNQLFISILAGTKTERLESLTENARVIRTMPNLALAVSASATGYCLGKNATEEDARVCESIFSPLGVCARVEEDKMSDVTALSGSGIAYFCYLAEAMSGFAQKEGIDEKTAKELSAWALIGAAKLLCEKDDPAEIRRKVTSKGGTTEAAIGAMTDGGFISAVEKGYAACKKRSLELGK